MDIVLLRHSEKSSQPMGNPSLTLRGIRQSQSLPDMKPFNQLPTPVMVWSSPKKRALETTSFLSQRLEVSVSIQDHLDEQKESETHQAFDSRVKNSIDQITQSSGQSIVVCSHYDWLEKAISFIPTDASDSDLLKHFSTASFKHFRIEEGLWKFIREGSGQ